MKRFGVGLAVFGLMFSMSSTTEAQPGGGRGGMGGGKTFLLVNKSVQEELKVTDEQKEKLKSMATGGGRDAFKQFKDLSKDEMMTKFKEMAAESEKKMAEILKPEQIKRLTQISLQQNGVRSLLSDEAKDALKLTTEQKEKITAIAEESAKEMRDLREEMREDAKGAQKKMTSLRKESMDKATDSLTAEQKKAWKDLVGEPFEMKVDANPFGGRGKGKNKEVKE